MALDNPNTKVLIHFNGTQGSTTFTDESGKTWTPASGAVLETGFKVFGTACGNFPAKWITTSDHADFNVGANDFTLDFRLAILSGVSGIIFYHPGAGTYSWMNLQLAWGVLKMYISSNGSSWNISNGANIGTFSVPYKFYHVAITRTGGNLCYFFEGSKIGTISVSTTALMEGTGDVYIGGYSGQAAQNYIDEFRFMNGTAAWTDNFTVPTRPYGEYQQYLIPNRNRFQTTGISLGS
jgi:hypothetical protein